MTKMAADDALDKAIEDVNNNGGSSINSRNGEGVVHGHIHNYDNITYIHGHVHHGHQQDNSNLRNLTDAHEGWDYLPSIDAVENKDLFCNEYDSCEHFEFVNYHTSKQVPKAITRNGIIDDENAMESDSDSCPDGVIPIQRGDQVSASVSRKRTFSDIISGSTGDCNPKILEVCCDMDHAPFSVSMQELLESIPSVSQDDFGVCNNTKNSLSGPWLTPTESISRKEPLDIDCDLTCICPQQSHYNLGAKDENKESEDDIIQNLHKDVEPNQQRLQINNFHRHRHHRHRHQHHFHKKPSAQQCSREVNDKCDYYGPLHMPLSTSPLSKHSQRRNLVGRSYGSPFDNNHSMVCNDHVDMKVLGDLCDISSLYEFPSANHMNHHNHSHDHAQEHSDQDLDVLQSTVGGTNTRRASSTHHHHRIEFYQPGYPCLAREKNEKILSNVKLEDEPPFVLPHTRNPRPCGGNPETEMNTINFNWFFKNQNSDSLKCEWDQCLEQFPSLIDLQKHMFKAHVPQEEATSNLLCNWNECRFKGDDLCSLVNHINSDHGINFGMKVLDSVSSLQKKEQHDLLHCDGHEEESIDSFSHRSPKLQCQWDDCNQCFFTTEDLSNHLEKFHLPRGKSEYYCHWRSCSRRFTQRQKMVRHLRVHSGHKPYRCQVCSKSFSSEDTLNQHMRIHSGEKPFECHLCEKRFSVSSSLKIHIRTHTGEKPLQCKICAKRFNESSNLNKHLKTHRKKYKCSSCARSFDTEDKLTSHQFICYNTPPRLTQIKL